MKKKFGKSYKNIFRHKSVFFQNPKAKINEINLKKNNKINSIYLAEPKRKNCKICLEKLKTTTFKSHNISYIFCHKCGHLNGDRQETNNFFLKLNQFEKKKNFYNYSKKNYNLRVKDIYIPKVNFLKSNLKNIKKIIDYGSGGGYFINACNKKEITSFGVEINNNLINLSECFNKGRTLNFNNYEQINDFIKKKKIKCISAINVIEHIKDPLEFFNFFKRSSLKYMFLAVPLASLSVLIEICNQEMFSKQLGAYHTHLFTKKSIRYLIKKYRLKIVGEWWFGADFADLLRVFYLKNTFFCTKTFDKFAKGYFYKYLDEMQLILDKNEICQEVHIILKK